MAISALGYPGHWNNRAARIIAAVARPNGRPGAVINDTVRLTWGSIKGASEQVRQCDRTFGHENKTDSRQNHCTVPPKLGPVRSPDFAGEALTGEVCPCRWPDLDHSYHPSPPDNVCDAIKIKGSYSPVSAKQLPVSKRPHSCHSSKTGQ